MSCVREKLVYGWSFCGWSVPFKGALSYLWRNFPAYSKGKKKACCRLGIILFSPDLLVITQAELRHQRWHLGQYEVYLLHFARLLLTGSWRKQEGAGLGGCYVLFLRKWTNCADCIYLRDWEARYHKSNIFKQTNQIHHETSVLETEDRFLFLTHQLQLSC